MYADMHGDRYSVQRCAGAKYRYQHELRPVVAFTLLGKVWPDNNKHACSTARSSVVLTERRL